MPKWEVKCAFSRTLEDDCDVPRAVLAPGGDRAQEVAGGRLSIIHDGGGEPPNKRFILYRMMKSVNAFLSELICGPVRSRPGGPVEKIVAADGWNGYETLSTTEIYDLATDSWSKGTPLPEPLYRATVVPYETTLLVVGGRIYGSGYSDKVYRYTESGDWQELGTLQEPKNHVAAMLVPSSLFE